ncbi:SH3 domain-containing protein [Priestia aryabhattai]
MDIVAKNGDWYKIKFGTGYGYIMAVKSGLQILPSTPTKQLKLTTTVKLYSEASMLSKNLGALAPQTVTVIEEKPVDGIRLKVLQVMLGLPEWIKISPIQKK